ncbi:MAG: mannan endo-1,4-beta-mannosidase [Rhodothermales bacterium]|jgi:mannan endo-1,4-beta-mannosidase
MKRAILLLAFVLANSATAQTLIDPDASAETQALYTNLHRLAKEGILFGHHDSTKYGSRWSGEADRSDVHDVVGAWPAVYGWDILNFGIWDDSQWVIDEMAQIRTLITEAYSRGGINTICWHMRNPVSGAKYDDTTNLAVTRILPDGDYHERYLQLLAKAATYFNSLRGPDGEAIPIIFRPFHEHNKEWFWWGDEFCTPDEYIALWRFTVDYFRKAGAHNLIWAYSPDRFLSRAEYLERYPGDDYVDVLGVDNYWYLRSTNGYEETRRMFRTIARECIARGKIAALTETGLEGVKTHDWFTRVLLPAFRGEPAARYFAYALIWRNADQKHHYAPFPRHSSAADFRRFHADPLTLFEDDLPDVYHIPSEDAPEAERTGRADWLRDAIFANVETLYFRRQLESWQERPKHTPDYPAFANFATWSTGFDPIEQNVRGLRSEIRYAVIDRENVIIEPEMKKWVPDSLDPVDIQIDQQGLITGSALPSFLHANTFVDRIHQLRVELDNPAARIFTVAVSSISPGGASLRVRLDDHLLRDEPLTVPAKAIEEEGAVMHHRGGFSVGVPPGKHVLLIDNPGPDWLRIGACYLQRPKETAIVRGVIGDKMALAWMRNTTFITDQGLPTPIQQARLLIYDLPVGTWRVETWDPAKGAGASSLHKVGGNGLLVLPIVNLERDIAYRIIRE